MWMGKRVIRRALVGFVVLGLVSLLGCGGGGGGGGSGGGGSSGGGGGGTTPTTKTVSGTAASGRPLDSAVIYLKDSKGSVTYTIADRYGQFSFDTSNLTPPFYLKTQEFRLFSYAEEAGTANITPLTTAVVAVANGGNPDIYTNPPSQLNITPAEDSLKALIDPVLQRYDVQDAYLITTSFEANGRGMDAVLDSIWISVNEDNQTIEIQNPFTGETIGRGTFSNGTIESSDPVTQGEADSLPNSVTHRKYFAYVKDAYGSPEQGPSMTDVVMGEDGKIYVTITNTEGDTGDMFFIYGNGIKNENSIQFTAAVVLCSDTDPNGTATAEFTGTIGQNGDMAGDFTNILSQGDECRENNSNIYGGTWRAEDVTDALPAEVSGTYDGYATPDGGWQEEGPVQVEITQNNATINVSITPIGQDTPVTGKGTVYGNYVIFRTPIILGRDASGNAKAEYATFFGKFDDKTNTITGWYGDGVPPGDYDKDTDGNKTRARGIFRAIKR